jgi:hypothetical protein
MSTSDNGGDGGGDDTANQTTDKAKMAITAKLNILRRDCDKLTPAREDEDVEGTGTGRRESHTEEVVVVVIGYPWSCSCDRCSVFSVDNVGGRRS